jgi:hypothetical protein
MNPAGTLEGFQGRIQYFHSDQEKGIIGVLLAHPEDNVAKPIISKIGYYHVRSDNKFHFYLPGYFEENSWCNYPNRCACKIGDKGVSFCDKWFAEFIDYFENEIINYHYSGNPELLLFNVNNGKIDFAQKIRLNLKEIQRQDKDFDNIFEEIYQTIKLLGDTSLTDFKLEFGAEAVGRTLIDSFWNAASKLPLLKEFKRNTTGIYFL